MSSNGWVFIAKRRYYCFRATKRTIQAKSEQHHEEYQCPEGGAGHGGDGRRVHHEHQARALGGHVLDLFSGRVRHVPQHAEYYEARHKRCSGIDHAS